MLKNITLSAEEKHIEEARKKAYENIGGIRFEGMQYRDDIGLITPPK